MWSERETADELIRLGRIAGPHGVRGWVRIRSDTEPRNAILAYQPWLIGPERVEMRVVEGASSGRSVLAALAGVNDRAVAEELTGREILVHRSQLPGLAPNQYYWADLVGSAVLTTDGVSLGELSGMMETGANDVMLVRGDRERLIPFVLGRYVRKVDVAAKRIEVDWDPDF